MSLSATVWKYLSIVCISPLSHSVQYVFECYEPGRNPNVVTVDFNAFDLPEQCRNAIKISHPSTQPLVLSTLSEYEVNELFNFDHLHMCIFIAYETFTSLNLNMKELTGDCEGPLLQIIGNLRLTSLTVGDFINNLDADAIRIRANPLLPKSQLDQFSSFSDIQVEGECLMPSSLASQQSIPYNCDHLYGVMYMYGRSSADTDDQWNDYVYAGCIQLKSTTLINVDFLKHFMDFTPIPGCKQYISNNSDLCVGNSSLLREAFGDIDIYNNKMDCQCLMPSSLASKWSIPYNCDHLYGVMYIYGSSSADTDDQWNDYVYTGCIQLKSTTLINVDFLKHFMDFTPIPGCKQYISNNSDLCVGNSSLLREAFGDIDIYNNKMDCRM
ncbi:hypothetical protein DICVIV_13538 [Dictyocaulus viviparus]|uniref:Receptor L domain protein n=1 Tax=Dictyocaulus viviparus TaxID=29172 RepID=A0A0D8X7J1_DICVI|nr:hypothetical protein DICVIV_13538 [Dictyocaulus viviparus]